MHTPPFRLAQPSRLKLSGDDPANAGMHATTNACCTPGNAPQPRPGTQRRARLAELDGHLHCSIIGTCLSTQELRKLVPKFTNLDRRDASDLEIHHAAVELAIEGGACAKALHKSLDEHYAAAIRRFDQAGDDVELLKLWDEALKNGDIPPAYWALMTHRHATMPVRQKAFGDLHMLSHLVGAANRADIRRLVALEEENAALKEKIERQQSRLNELGAQRDASIAALNEQIAQLSANVARQIPTDAADLAAEAQHLRERLSDADQRVALHTSRREAAEQRVLQEQDAAQALRRSHDHALALLKLVQSECDALERATVDAADATQGAGARPASLDSVQGKRIVYVGGRPGSNTALKRLVDAAGGELLVHDGGLEDRKGLLAARVAGRGYRGVSGGLHRS
ncbi:regulator of replication initiation timing [Paraburkholderia bryophila]|uniref:Regulator of replication initiation timing n=1 Tax=Paraburkholderia bryophila TaxID=420952 RepID=A0A7Y9W9J1_9BURK|nr:regulator of replication initiation timing [Paraburkholderia bryophila]